MRTAFVVIVTAAWFSYAFPGEEYRHRTNDTTIVESWSSNLAEATHTPDPRVEKNETESPVEEARLGTMLTGHWNGTHDILNEGGIGLSLRYRADNLSNVIGGLSHRSSYVHQINLRMAVDGERLMNWHGLSLFVHAMSSNGESFSSFIGSAQTVSNIESSRSTKLYQAFLQQDLMAGRLSFLAGLFDLSSEFYVVEHSLLFVNSSFSVGKELSQTGRNGPSIFPIPSSAVRVRIKPNDGLAFQVAAFDAVPGSPSDRTTPSLFMSMDEGLLVIGEISYSWKGIPKESIGSGKYTAGAWFYSSDFEEVHFNAVSGGSVRSTSNSGFYFLGEQNICARTATEGFAIFTRLGIANGNINRYDYDFSAGAVYTGIFTDLDTDKLGFAFTYANNSLQYKRATLLRGSSIAMGELALELTYRGQVTPWLEVQPDFQYIINPGASSLIENALVFCTRFEVGF